VIKGLAAKLGIGRRFGRNRVIAEADLPTLEIGLRTLGYRIPVGPPPAEEEAVAGR
jgi:hypothetical protein